MNDSEKDLETVLRRAPQPKAPVDLEQTLLAAAPTSRGRAYRPAIQDSWWRRWWGALVPATISLACALVITAQQLEIRQLEQSVKSLSQTDVPPNAVAGPSGPSTLTGSVAEVATQEQAEIQRLKALAAKLSGEVTRLQSLRGENEKLRTQLASSKLTD